MRTFAIYRFCFLSIFCCLLSNTYLGGQTPGLDWRIIEAVFSKEQILELLNPTPSPQCTQCVVAGAIFRVGKNQTKIKQTKINRQTGRTTIEDIVVAESEYLEAYRVEWDGAGGVHLYKGPGSPLYPASDIHGSMGGIVKQQNTRGNLRAEFTNTRTFDFVFFQARTLYTLLDYERTTTGIIFSRIVLDGSSAINYKFQSLRATPNPQPPIGTDALTNEPFTISDRDAIAYVVGYACPPVWKEEELFFPIIATMKPLKKGDLFKAVKAIFGR